MMLRFLPAAVLLALASPASSQTQTLYIADALGTNSLYTSLGGTITPYAQFFGGEQGIAVRGDVRTQSPFGSSGKRYDLSLNPLAQAYADSGVGPFYDGATDGKHNYAMSQGDWWVYQMDRDWSNPTQLFYVGPVGGWGITWDGTDNSLWLTSMNGIVNYTMAGVPNQATINEFGGWEGGLAWEPATDTLWYSGHHSNGLQQIDKSGNFGQFYFPPWGVPQNGVGLEFNIPAPGLGGLFGLAALGVAHRRRPEF